MIYTKIGKKKGGGYGYSKVAAWYGHFNTDELRRAVESIPVQKHILQ